MLAGVIKSIGDTAREFSELEKLFAEDKQVRQLVFYGESPIQYRYYEDYIEYILKNSQHQICYLASDPNDPIFQSEKKRIKPFFIKNTLNAVFSRLDSKVLIMANPDLNKGAVKRAPDSVHHVYAFRGIASVHQGYRLGAFDHYDSLLCVGQYQVDEVRETERIYNLKPKQLPVIGYPLAERLYREHQLFKAERPLAKQTNIKPICLVAPTWDPFGRASIFDACAAPLIDALSTTGFEVWLRPHPEFVKRYAKKMDAITKLAAKSNNITVQTQLASMECLHRADILVTDHSSISLDYVLATERPVLLVNTPLRIDNPEAAKIALVPVETQFRSALGEVINLDQIAGASRVIESLFERSEEFKATVPKLRDQLVANWQQAGQVGGEYILSLLSKPEAE